jgi:hypothetical protein
MRKTDFQPSLGSFALGLSGGIRQDFLLCRATPGDYLPGLPAWWPDCELILSPAVRERAIARSSRVRVLRPTVSTKPGKGRRRCRSWPLEA